MSEPVEMYFNDFIKLNRGFDLSESNIVEGKYPIAASTSIKDYHKDFKVKAPCVTTGRSGSLGSVLFVNQNCWPLNTTLYVKDFKGNNPKYVYYFLQTMKLESFNCGAGVPTLNQNHLHKVKVKIHKKDEQHRIASILSAYDDLIENNNRRIALLEQIAEQIYKEWFVRMRFPGYENTEFEKGVPKGWKVKKVEPLVDRKRFGKTYNQDSVSQIGKVIVIDQSRNDFLGFHNNEPDHNATIENPMIIFGDHTCKMQMLVEPFSLGENVIPLTSDKNINVIFLYYVINSLIETTEYKRHWNELICKKVFVPNKTIQDLFGEFIKPLMVLKNMLWYSNFVIKQTRDLLLPRLISGKLKVKEAEKEMNNPVLQDGDKVNINPKGFSPDK